MEDQKTKKATSIQCLEEELYFIRRLETRTGCKKTNISEEVLEPHTNIFPIDSATILLTWNSNFPISQVTLGPSSEGKPPRITSAYSSAFVERSWGLLLPGCTYWHLSFKSLSPSGTWFALAKFGWKTLHQPIQKKLLLLLLGPLAHPWGYLQKDLGKTILQNVHETEL